MKSLLFVLACLAFVLMFSPIHADGAVLRGTCASGVCGQSAEHAPVVRVRPVVSVLVKPVQRAEAIVSKAVHPRTWKHQPIRNTVRFLLRR